MIRLAAAFFISCLVLLPLHAHAQRWAVFQPEGIGYSVELPGEWKIETGDLNSKAGTQKFYSAGVGMPGRSYLTGYSSYPENIVRAATVSVLLDGARNGAIENVKGQLRTEERILISNLPGRHFIIDAPGNLVAVMN